MYISPFKHQYESNKSEFEWVHLFYSYELGSRNSLYDYTVMLIEGDEFECVFNWAHFDKGLYLTLAPVICQDTQYCLTNINKIQNYDILSSILEKNIVSSVDLDPSWYKYHFIYLYPYQLTDQKVRHINIPFEIQSISRCDIDKRKFSLWIWSAIISDCEVMSILESKCWDFIAFKDWTIISTNGELNQYSIKQKWIFDSWVFKNQENKINESDFITRIFTTQNKKGNCFIFISRKANN